LTPSSVAELPWARKFTDVDAYRVSYVELAEQFAKEHFNAAHMAVVDDVHEATQLPS
jgi:hypothetical protein